MSAHLVSVIDTKDFGASTVRIGDLNGDGAPDLLFVQSEFYTRKITCLTATTIFGDRLWQIGAPSLDNGLIYSDLPVQIYDWDNDGRNEALYIEQATYLDVPRPERLYQEYSSAYEGVSTLVALDAITAEEKCRLQLPAGADDCIIFADLTGRGYPSDLVVKNRYRDIWGVSKDGVTLWHYKGSAGHFPAVADIDGDGRDEVFTGLALIDDNGEVIFDRSGEGYTLHSDANVISYTPDGEPRLLYGNGGVHCLTADGTELWHKEMPEAQHVIAGRFIEGSTPTQFMAIERGAPRNEMGKAALLLYDADGQELWRREYAPGTWASAVVAIDWSGNGYPGEVMLYGMGTGRPALIVNGEGEIIEELEMKCPEYRTEKDRIMHFYGARADVWGDSRQEAILFGPRSACIYSNASPQQIPTLYNNTLYPGM